MALRLSSLLLILLTACGAARTAPASPAPVVATVAIAPTATVSAGIVATGNTPAPALIDSDQIPVGDAPVLGPHDALVTLVVFSDFECPFCARVESTLSDLHRRYANDLRIVWRNSPLPFHPHARLAAEAALAARAQGRFWEMHDVLFENRASLDRQSLDRYATQLGLDTQRFAQDLDAHTFAAVIDADMALATRLNVQGVPNMYVNGTHIIGARPVEQFVELIDRVLARAHEMPRDRVYADMVREALAHDDEFPAPSAPAARPTRPSHGELDPTTVYRVPVGDSPVRGPADALVTIVVFSDFQCPFCSRVEPTLAALANRYGRDVRFVWKNNPLPFHANAMPAATAALEVYRQQGAAAFWHFHDTLFQNQSALDRASLERYARTQTLDMTAFRNALDNDTHAARIHEDMQLATSLDAIGTPTSFINGRRVVGAQPIDTFVSVVDSALTEARRQVAHGISRANLYAHLTDNAATAPVYLPVAHDGGGGDDPRHVYAVRSNPAAPTRGAANATVVLEEFSDFECPFCARLDPTLEQVMRTYGTRVRLVWRDYPLPFHSHAMAAAEAGREVLAQRGVAAFWQFHDTVYQNQRALERADLERYAVMVGVDLTRFRRALDQHTHQASIRADISAADATGAGMGTPATFVNGRVVMGAQPFSEFQRVIDEELQRTGRGGSGRP